MKLFNNDGKTVKDTSEGKVAGKIARLIIKVQTGFAEYLNRSTNNMSTRSLKWSLGLFLISGVFMSALCVVTVFSNEGNVNQIRVDRIRIPKLYEDNTGYEVEDRFLISPRIYEKMKVFKDYMDSLQQSKLGKVIYDSILLKRPGLMDSVRYLERIYMKQSPGNDKLKH